MDEEIESFVLHCTLYCQGNTTLTKSQGLETLTLFFLSFSEGFVYVLTLL